MTSGSVRFVVCGETLIDLVPAGDETGAGDGDTFSSTWLALSAGGPMNSAVALGRLGADTHFLGRLSSDSFGAQLRGHIEGAGVSLDLATESSQATSIAVVSLDAEGAASYTFHFAETANFGWQQDDLPALNSVGLAAHRLTGLRDRARGRGAARLGSRSQPRDLLRHQRPAFGDRRPGAVLGQGEAVAAGRRPAPRHPQGQRRRRRIPGRDRRGVCGPGGGDGGPGWSSTATRSGWSPSAPKAPPRSRPTAIGPWSRASPPRWWTRSAPATRSWPGSWTPTSVGEPTSRPR